MIEWWWLIAAFWAGFFVNAFVFERLRDEREGMLLERWPGEDRN